HREYRTLARLARHRHVAPHHARELAGDGKAKPRAAVAARGQGVGLGEVLKQVRLRLCRHAGAGSAPASSPQSRRSATFRALCATSPSFVNLQALLKRLRRICLSRRESAVSAPTLSWASTMSRFWFFSASCPAVPTTSSMSRVKFTGSGLSSSLPALIFDRSNISLMSLTRWVPPPFTRPTPS